MACLKLLENCSYKYCYVVKNLIFSLFFNIELPEITLKKVMNEMEHRISNTIDKVTAVSWCF